MKRKVLIFGVSGEIGGRIAYLAAEAGHDVTGVSRGNRPNLLPHKAVKYIPGDKYDEHFLSQLSALNDFDVVIDTVPTDKSVDIYEKYFPGVENILFCSSTGTFVPLQYFPADEKHQWRNETEVNFYPQCIRDAYALERFATGNFPVTIFRPTNIIGEGRVPLELWGARDIEFFRKLKAGEPITIAPCENIMLQSGYNWDLASAFVLALDHPDEIRGEIFVISCKRAITLGRYLATAMDYFDSKSEITHCPAEKLIEIYPQVTMRYRMDFLLCHMNFDISKAERILGYEPTKTTEEGLVLALRWCEEQKML